MLTEQTKEQKQKRFTRLQTVHTLSKEYAEEYIMQSYAERKNVVIHYIVPSAYAGYDVCFSYEID